MVAPSSLATFADIDSLLIGREALSHRYPANVAGGGGSARAVEIRASIKVQRLWEITITQPDANDLIRFREVWDKTARGTLPASYTPQGEGSAIPVVILETSLRRVKVSATRASALKFTLREWPG